MGFFFPNEKKLGVSQGRRRYDLPLNNTAGTGFLILLVGLMTFLGVMALVGSFALSSMAHHWSSGLENKMTIEIPAEDGKGDIRSPEQIAKLSEKVYERIEGQNFIRSANIMSREDIQDLLSPWLGDDDTLADIPLPGLISVELITINDTIMEKMHRDLKQDVSNVKLDTHESWLADILKLTGALQFSTFLISLIIGVTTAIAIAGAVKSRIAIHKKDVELLHLMGASDTYISRQFQRHSLILALQGSVAGAISGLIIVFVIGFFAGSTSETLLPDFSLNMVHIFTLMALPLFACLLAGYTAKYTVLRELSLMP